MRRTVDVHLKVELQGREYDAIANRIASDRPARVLDWGAGFGQMTARLRARGLDTTAFAWVEGAALGTQRSEHFPEIELVISGEPVALPFNDGEFDAILSCGVLEHVHDPNGSLVELRRLLAPGGRLYVYKLPNRTSYLEAIARRLGWYYHGSLEHDTIYSLKSAAALLQQHGYLVESNRYANMLPLTVTHPLVDRFSEPLWTLNTALSHVPGIDRLATNVELIAAKPT